MSITRWLARGLVVLGVATAAPGAGVALMQPEGGGSSADASADGAPVGEGQWPRVLTSGERTLTIFEPQVDRWDNHTDIHVKLAISIAEGADQEPVFGVVEATATTQVDTEQGLVLLTNPSRTIRFPNLPQAEADRLVAMLDEAVPPRASLTVALPRLLAYVEDGGARQREVAVNMDPPPIFSSDAPAVLVIFIGPPEFEPAGASGLMFAVNTNWDVAFHAASGTYYLLAGDRWMSTTDIEHGDWSPGTPPAEAVQALPADGNWDDVRASIANTAEGTAPRVFVSTTPAEIIITDGAPRYTPISGTRLMYVPNTDSALIFDPADGWNYLLLAGRWFRAQDLAGPWTSAAGTLPEDMAKIPQDHAMAFVLPSVPGTTEADDAILLASVPTMATVNRADLTLEVTYEGEPRFEPVEGSTVQFAVNTPYSVVSASGAYYCCYQGVWFTGPTPTGAWVVASSIPAEIYTIPPSNPIHNVTYVTVYESTDNTVTTGYTSGYKGQYVAAGALVFGAGVLLGAAIADDDDWHHWHYGPAVYGYGCGAVYHYGCGSYWRSGGYAYGPYGGAGRVASYNPSTGAWSRGAVRYGPSGAAFAREGYNPVTDTYAARAGATTPYGSWSRGVVSRGDEWARGGQASGWRGSAGWVEGSQGGAAVSVDRRFGSDAAAVQTRSGDVYVGHDGNVYRRGDDGWQSYNGQGDWSNRDRPATPRPTTTSAPGGREPGARPQPTTTNRTQATQSLDRQAQARERGAASTSRYEQSRASAGARGSSGTAGSRGGRRR